MALAAPVALVGVAAGYSRMPCGSQAMAGAVGSRTVMVWVRFVQLPHSSVARQTREMGRLTVLHLNARYFLLFRTTLSDEELARLFPRLRVEFPPEPPS